MARKPTVNLEALTALGVERLAALVLDAAERDATFKKIVSAALAGAKGPDAVAALIDRRLAALEKARSMIDWDKAKIFAADLASLTASIVGELGPSAPRLAFDRLIRFIATHGKVFDRVDDSSGRIQAVYEAAVDAAATLAEALPTSERADLVPPVEHAMMNATHGYFGHLIGLMAPLLDPETLRGLDRRLASTAAALPARRSYEGLSIYEIIAVRQDLADALGDLDSWIALETEKPEHARDTQKVAERLTGAGRHSEALEWIRRPHRRAIGYVTVAAYADGGLETPVDWTDPNGVLLEARILDALDRTDEAQARRWACFEKALLASVLRAYLDRLGDFEEFAALDRAFATAAAHPGRHQALSFFSEWKRWDLAAKLVLDHEGAWSGSAYDVLVPIAKDLEEAHPLAATVLYRALLADILDRGKSQAYGHGVRYLDSLDRLANHVTDDWGTVALPHAEWRDELRRKHGRKSSFWAQVPLRP